MTDSELLLILADILLALMAISVVTGVIRHKHLGYYQKIITLVCLTSLLTTLIVKELWKQGINNHLLFHIYAVIEYILLSFLYGKAFQNNRIAMAYRLSAIIILIWGLVNALFIQGYDVPNTYVTTPAFIIWIGSSLFLFFRILNELRYKKLEKSALFWINIGVLIYFSGSFVLVVFYDRILSTTLAETMTIRKMHILLNIIHYLTFNIALWMRKE